MNKKTTILLLALLALGGGLRAQIVHYYNTTPFLGDKLYGISVGTLVASVPHMEFGQPGNLSRSVPLSASLHFEGEESVSNRIALGFQFEPGLSHYGYSYDRTALDQGFGTPIAGKTDHVDLTILALGLDVRFAFDYYFTDELEGTLAAGIYERALFSGSAKVETTDDATSLPVGTRSEQLGDGIFDFSTLLSISAGVKYYISERFYASANFRMRQPFKRANDDWSRVADYGLMVGLGWKVIH